MISVTGNVVDISEILEIGRIIEDYFEHNVATEAEIRLLEDCADGKHCTETALILVMVIEGSLVAYIDLQTGNIMLRKVTYWDRIKRISKRMLRW